MTANQILVKMILDRWNASVKNCDQLLNTLSDDQLQQEIALGKNRGIYLLGHLIAVHDDMLALLNLGDKKYPALNKIFIEAPDKTIVELPSIQELRLIWAHQNEELKQKFESLTADNWFEKHTAVSEGDFAVEPHRNKLNIILTRTTHLAYHTGQLILLKS
jgi:hypothetical protein